MTSSTIDQLRIGNVFAIVDEDGPDIDEGEEEDVGEFLEREHEGEDVVGQGLRPAIYGVEGVAGIGRGHDPFVMRLVQHLVDSWEVQPAVDEVDPEIGEDDEERELHVVVPHAGAFGSGIIELCEAAVFGYEERRCEDGHDGQRARGLSDFIADLVLEEFGVVEGRLVEDEDVGERRKYEINYETEYPGDKEEACSFSV